jgi:DNA-binding MarR family transcriptional regulator
MSSHVTLPCMCASFRRASRALTQLYDDALRPLGLRVTQFTILQVLSIATEISQGELALLLVMDSTTLTRTLRLMRARGWIEERPGQDRRERWLRLSPAGQKQLKRATVPWQALQSRLRSHFGAARWSEWLEGATEISHQVAGLGLKPAGSA